MSFGITVNANLLDPSFEPSDEQLRHIMQAARTSANLKRDLANHSLFDRLRVETGVALEGRGNLDAHDATSPTQSTNCAKAW